MSIDVFYESVRLNLLDLIPDLGDGFIKDLSFFWIDESVLYFIEFVILMSKYQLIDIAYLLVGEVFGKSCLAISTVQGPQEVELLQGNRGLMEA